MAYVCEAAECEKGVLPAGVVEYPACGVAEGPEGGAVEAGGYSGSDSDGAGRLDTTPGSVAEGRTCVSESVSTPVSVSVAVDFPVLMGVQP